MTDASIVKIEPMDPSHPATSDPSALPQISLPGGGADEPPTNVLVPKKKARRRRSPASDDDVPATLPPMQTIRLEKELLGFGETLEWNIMDDARERGLIPAIGAWAEDKEDLVKEEAGVMDVDGLEAGNVEPANKGGAGTGGILGLLNEDAEEIARRLEEKYGDANKPKKAKVRRAALSFESSGVWS